MKLITASVTEFTHIEIEDHIFVIENNLIIHSETDYNYDVYLEYVTDDLEKAYQTIIMINKLDKFLFRSLYYNEEKNYYEVQMKISLSDFKEVINENS